MAAGRLCAGQSLVTPQAAGAAGGVVSLEADKRPREIQNTPENSQFAAIVPAISAVTRSILHHIAKCRVEQRLLKGIVGITKEPGARIMAQGFRRRIFCVAPPRTPTGAGPVDSLSTSCGSITISRWLEAVDPGSQRL